MLSRQQRKDYTDRTSAEEMVRKQADTACDLATRLVEDLDLLEGLLPALCQRVDRTYLLGKAIAEKAVDPLPMLKVSIQHTLETQDRKRSYEFLSGFLVGLAHTHPTEVEAFKQTAAESPDLAPALPHVAARIGVTDSDVDLAISALNKKMLHPRSFRFWSWGRCMESVSTIVVSSPARHPN